ncbi:hypothetical protein EVAR_19782_1 [Eumeta japonica]|uniref:Uncharacterized protein n=1 Tax=Eumeta variegata TaxID=151549 RepID=A0A4C1URA2_EUMVA|nr:hypothetical protein EVAR_19782_1 [Eumeta japonica]
MSINGSFATTHKSYETSKSGARRYPTAPPRPAPRALARDPTPILVGIEQKRAAISVGAEDPTLTLSRLRELNFFCRHFPYIITAKIIMARPGAQCERALFNIERRSSFVFAGREFY